MIYLAAPYSTGLPEGIDPADAMRQRADIINKAAAQLMEEGHIVYSPISHGVSLESHVSPDNLKSHTFWMHHCFGMLDRARSLCVLRISGWEESRGVQMEINRALRNGLNVVYMEAPTC